MKMVDTARRVPVPTAAGWLSDLSHLGAPMFVVLRQHEAEARACLAIELVELGVVAGYDEATVALTEAAVEHGG